MLRTALLAVILLCAVVGAQAASLAAQHSHHQASEHCCTLCHLDPPPFLQPAAAQAPAPDRALAWMVLCPDPGLPPAPQSAHASSRAPPV